MFIVISHHTCKPGQADLAKGRMDKNASHLASEPGFLHRFRMSDESRPELVSALTIWESREHYENNRRKRFGNSRDLSETPYEKIETESFAVDSHVEGAGGTEAHNE